MAYKFNGTNANLYSTGIAPLNSTKITISCWVRVDTITPATNQSIVRLASLFSTAAGLSGMRILRNTAGNVLAQIGDSTTANTATAPNLLRTNQWIHLAAQFDGSGTTSNFRRAWLGGQAGTADTVNRTIDQNWTSLQIGAAASYNISTGQLTFGQYYSGDLSHVAVWFERLGDAEIVGLAGGANPLDIRPQALVAYFPMRQIDDLKFNIGQGTFGPRNLAIGRSIYTETVQGSSILDSNVQIISAEAPVRWQRPAPRI